MLETPHVAVGAAIATQIPNPFISIPLAFLSHFVMERVPHWNPHIVSETKKYGSPTLRTRIIIAADVLMALVLGTYIASRVLPDTNHAAYIMLASLASVMPDLMEFPYFFLNMRNKFLTQWLKFQKSLQVDTTPFWGLLTQVITIAAVFLWLQN